MQAKSGHDLFPIEQVGFMYRSCGDYSDFSTKHKADLGVMKDLADFSQYTERTWQTGLIFQKMLAGTAGVKAGNLEGRIFVSSV